MKVKECYRVYCRRLPYSVEIKFNKKAKKYIEENAKELNEYEILEKVIKWYLNDELEEIITIDSVPMIKLENFILHGGVFLEIKKLL